MELDDAIKLVLRHAMYSAIEHPPADAEGPEAVEKWLDRAEEYAMKQPGMEALLNKFTELIRHAVSEGAFTLIHPAAMARYLSLAAAISAMGAAKFPILEDPEHWGDRAVKFLKSNDDAARAVDTALICIYSKIMGTSFREVEERLFAQMEQETHEG